MVVKLQPLEFTDCLTDSPQFRENLREHENELHKTSQQIKQLIKEVKDLIQAARNLSRAQRTLSESLKNFRFESIGGSRTDDEVQIADSLQHFSSLISSIEDERDRMLDNAYDQIIVPLDNFRKEHIGGVKEEKKKFDKQTAKFCQTQERCLNMSTKKQGNALQEADAQLDMAERHFCQASLDYVFRLQEVQERKKFEFVETLMGFMLGWLTFYHQGYEVAKDFKPYMDLLQLKIQKTRDNFVETRNQTESLKQKMLELRQQKGSESGRSCKGYSKEGYLFLMEKKAFGTTWTKQYCTYQKNNKEFTMTPYNQLTTKVVAPPPTLMVLSSCTRRMSETIEKRFCFDVSCESRPGIIYTLQALSEEDRKAWMDVMDGKEPTYAQQQGKIPKPEERALDDIGFSFVKRCIEVLEERGLEEQGLYRIVGVTSKVNKLLAMGLDRRKAPERLSGLDDRIEWESKTITSSLKLYLRNLPEPIMTYRYHNGFIAAAKQETRQMRINDVHCLVHRLPKANFEMLELLIRHLKLVSTKCDKNLMPVSNLAVCFGPTLLRPEEETVASIMDIKFYNVVVEILIDNYEKIFKTQPEPSEIQPEIQRGPSESQNHVNNINNIMFRTSQPIIHSARYSNSHNTPVTHAVIKTYYDGPMSSSVHNVTSSHDPELNGGIGYVGGNGSIPHAELRPPHRMHPATAMSAYSEGNLHNMQAYAPPINKRIISMPPTTFHNTGLNDVKSDTFNSTSSSNESVSSSSPREGGSLHSGSISHYSSPQKTRRGNGMGIHYAKGYRPQGSLRVRTLYTCHGENVGELSFQPNQIITNVKSSLEPGWLEGTLNGKTGLVPENYVEMLP